MEDKRLFHKDFTLVVIGQIISLFGNGIVRFALPLYLLKQTGSATLFGLVTALSFLPMIVLMPIGGIIADRVNKRNIMVVLDFATAALMCVFLILLGRASLVALLVITLMLLYGIQGAYQPTVQASMPLLHSGNRLLSANAIVNQVGALANLLAPILGGVLFGIWGLVPIIWIGGICFFCSAVMEIFIAIPYTKQQEKQSVFLLVKQDFQESFHFMRKEKPIILKTIGIICLYNFILSAMLMVAMPVVITKTLALSEQLYGYAQGALAAGGLFGGVLVGVFAKRLDIKKVSLLLFITALLLLPMGGALWLSFPPFISYLTISICCFFLMSVATMVTVQLLTFIQGETPIPLLGKVLSCVMALSICAQPLGQAIYGYLFDLLQATPHVILFGAAMLSGAVALLSKRVFHNLISA